ncbi:AAA family ATPase [Jannaschia formosa]|uniref:AAA family ATPase n=1 Tax=Jannaschia formosa TaxID=2259592 RepID=UPI000E1C3AC3|nr:AAA family ATPase [Jannaschia formosa]TFL15981.1 hypothetical protein DR046_22470 [Jannaschia formosa]
MSFLDARRVHLASELRMVHIDFPRSKNLREHVRQLLSSHLAGLAIGEPFETGALVVTGASRNGKTREIRSLLAEVRNDHDIRDTISELANEQGETRSETPAIAVSCDLSGKLTWKDLGEKTAHALGLPVRSGLTQARVWGEVIIQARRRGVVIIHYDECQHIFGQGAEKTNAKVIDCFKSLLKDSDWPIMLVLSGVPLLDSFIDADSPEAEQFRPLARRCRLPDISEATDLRTLADICFAYGDVAGIDVEPLLLEDFLQRLAYASSWRWGLAIEFIIEAVIRTVERGASEVSTEDFVTGFAEKYGLEPDYSPFTLSDYRGHIDPEKLLHLSSA